MHRNNVHERDSVPYRGIQQRVVSRRVSSRLVSSLLLLSLSLSSVVLSYRCSVCAIINNAAPPPPSLFWPCQLQQQRLFAYRQDSRHSTTTTMEFDTKTRMSTSSCHCVLLIDRLCPSPLLSNSGLFDWRQDLVRMDHCSREMADHYCPYSFYSCPVAPCYLSCTLLTRPFGSNRHKPSTMPTEPPLSATIPSGLKKAKRSSRSSPA